MASKRFAGRGKADRGAYIGGSVAINGFVEPRAYIYEGATVDGHVRYGGSIGASAVIESGATVGLDAMVRERSVIKSGVTVPMGARVHEDYIVHAILSAGFDNRGYHVIAVLCQTRNDAGPSNPLEWRVMAGCRDFSFEDALRHWGREDWHGGSPDIAAKVAYLKKAVKIWEKENGKLGCRL